MPPRDSNSWSAIQWATYLELPSVLAMLRNAPPAIMSGEEKPERPTPGANQEEFLKHWGPKAAVVEYRVQDDKPTLSTEFRSVQDVIYGTGPTATTTTKAVKGSDGLFTWVHLPATNDLLNRILIEEPSCLNDSQSNKVSRVNAFFESSWSQIPDTTSESRIMKPLCITEPMGPDSNADSPDRFLHAIYIPYLALSRQHRGQYHTGDDDCKGKQPQNEREKGEEGGKQEEDNDGRDQNEVDLQRAYDAYHGLLKCYKGNVIHGSATLDVSFYGFPRSQQKLTQQQESPHDVREHAAQQHDRQGRNENQVVTKGIHPEGVAERSCWTLVRVNQLWVWIIGHKWLITATTHPIDQTEDTFLTDVLNHIEKRAGRARSPLEMAKAIVEYCADSYDRQPKSTAYGTNHSIHQIFLESINKIAREDAKLFEDFCEHMEAKQPKGNDKPDVGESEEIGTKHKTSKKEDKVNMNECIEEAIKAAARLSSEIRNIRDKLRMLRAIAKHQMRVQKKLENGSSADNGPWESYVMSDIEEMIGSADGIKSNVEMTLSLGQRQIANNQAKEGVKQGEIANEQAVLANQQARERFQQGRTIMIFTATTPAFLTSSSLSSLFAMDVDSFRKVPYWASLPTFLVLAALLYILWLRKINRDADVGGSSKEEADNSKDKKKERVKTMRSVKSEKEDWHIVRDGLVTWRRRRRESPSEV